MNERPETHVRTRMNLVFKVLFIGALLGVTVLSVVPTTDVPGPESDKLGHLIAYTVLTLLVVLSLSGDRGVPRGFWIALLFVFLFGVLMEVVQHYIGRQFDLKDMAANAVGVVLGAGAGLLARTSVRLRG